MPRLNQVIWIVYEGEVSIDFHTIAEQIYTHIMIEVQIVNTRIKFVLNSAMCSGKAREISVKPVST